MTKILLDSNELFSPMEAAKMIGVSYATLYRKIKAGEIIPIRVAGQTLISQSEIDRINKGKEG